ncbi:MAG: hypothetical protein EOM53_00495 [Alphaproteobacteria bacterium]|nr:hypothetical protein [Alphaproteobacteria bacterium]
MSHKITPDGISITQGDSLYLPITFNGMDITNATLNMQVSSQDLKTLFIDKKVSTHIDAANGKTALNLMPSDINIPVGDYVTDMELCLLDGQILTFYPERTEKQAFFRVLAQVTKEE